MNSLTRHSVSVLAIGAVSVLAAACGNSTTGSASGQSSAANSANPSSAAASGLPGGSSAGASGTGGFPLPGGGSGSASAPSAPGGATGGSSSGGTVDVSNVCGLLSASSVDAVFGVSGVKASPGTPQKEGPGVAYTCKYIGGGFGLALVAIKLPSSQGTAQDFIHGVTSKATDVVPVSGVGDGAAYFKPAGESQQVALGAAEQRGSNIIGLDLDLPKNTNARSQLTTLAKQVLAAAK